MTGFDTVLATPGAANWVAAVATLYRIVYGRPADLGGLQAYVTHLHDGLPLPAMVQAFLDSDEFLRQVGSGDPASLLRQHAGGPDTTDDDTTAGDTRPLVDHVLALLNSEKVAAHLPVRPSLFPDGAPLDDPAAYRLWLATRPQPQPAPAVPISFVLVLEPGMPPHLADTLQSMAAAATAGSEILVAARWPSKELRLAIQSELGTAPVVRLIRAPLAYSRARLFNAALRRCGAAFTALVDAGERVDPALPAAFARVAGQADVVLSDEDQLDAEDLRHAPLLGASWDVDQALATGTTGILLARTAILRAIGGMRAAGERDLLLRAARHLADTSAAGRILHLPEVLLSRRQPSRAWANGARAPGPDDIRLTRAHLTRAHLAHARRGAAPVLHDGTIRIVHPLPKRPPKVSVVIATKDRAPLLEGCLDGLLNRTAYPHMEVVVVDNGSTAPDAVALLRRLAAEPRIRVLAAPGPFNWAALNNRGVQAAAGEVAVLLNNDIEVIHPEWLRELVSQAIRPDVGAAGAKLLYPDGRIQHAGVILAPDDHALHRWRFWPGEDRGYRGSLVVTREVAAVTGACLAIRRSVYDQVGGCDAANLPVTWNDVDLCLKVRAAGLRVIWTPHARLLHLEQATRGSDDLPENQARFLREQAWMRGRWGDTLRHDPFRIANLYPDEEGRRLAAE